MGYTIDLKGVIKWDHILHLDTDEAFLNAYTIVEEEEENVRPSNYEILLKKMANLIFNNNILHLALVGESKRVFEIEILFNNRAEAVFKLNTFNIRSARMASSFEAIKIFFPVLGRIILLIELERIKELKIEAMQSKIPEKPFTRSFIDDSNEKSEDHNPEKSFTRSFFDDSNEKSKISNNQSFNEESIINFFKKSSKENRDQSKSLTPASSNKEDERSVTMSSGLNMSSFENDRQDYYNYLLENYGLIVYEG